MLEYKGKQLEGSEDTEYKKELGETWVKLSKGKYRFAMVEKTEIQKIILEIARP